MKRAYFYPILISCVIVIICIGYFWWYDRVTTVILVRHAEKELNPTNPTNPNLRDPAGKDRAEILVDVAKDAGVTAIYTTEFCRTSQTAQPLANQLGLPLIVQDNGILNDQLSDELCEPDIDMSIERLPIAINTIAELVDEILSASSGKVVLVVGHSDTVPQMVEALGVDPLCPDYFTPHPDGSCKIPGNQYDNLFIVTVPRFFGGVKIIKARYGN